MLVVFESLLPIFLVVAIGHALKRLGTVDDAGWIGVERISYWLFFPALLIQTLAKADFSSMQAAGSALGLFSGIMALLLFMIALRLPMQRLLAVTPASWSSIYQATTRWNAFIVLAIVEKSFDPQWLAVVAIAIGAMIVPINILNVAVVSALGEREGAKPPLLRLIATNPLIIGVAIGIAVNLAGGIPYPPLATTLELVARISLPIGLLIVGAGLRFDMPRRALAAIGFATGWKLFVMPVFLAGAAWLWGVRGEELVVVALCGAGPSAMNGYLVARQLGGDAPLFAAAVTAQTLLSFFTIPLVIALARLAG